MVEGYWEDKNQLVGWAGVAVCASALAFLQWIVNKDSIEAPEPHTLIKYLLIDLACFSISLLIVGRWPDSALKRLLTCSAVALLGAIASTLPVDVPFFYRDMPNWYDTTDWYIHAAKPLLINSCVAWVAMVFIYGIGAVITGDVD